MLEAELMLESVTAMNVNITEEFRMSWVVRERVGGRVASHLACLTWPSKRVSPEAPAQLCQEPGARLGSGWQLPREYLHRVDLRAFDHHLVLANSTSSLDLAGEFCTQAIHSVD